MALIISLQNSHSMTVRSAQNMGPAEDKRSHSPKEMSQAISAQGSFLGQHSLMLRELRDGLTALTTSVHQVGALVENLPHPLLAEQPPAPAPEP